MVPPADAGVFDARRDAAAKAAHPREIVTSAEINLDNVEATLANGGLELTLVKAGVDQRRIIRVATSAAA